MESDSKNAYSGLRKRILAAMILAPTLPFILLTFIGYYYLNTSLRDETISRTCRIVEDHRQTVELFLAERKADLRFIAESRTPEELSDQATLDRIFQNLQATSQAFTDLGVFNESGLHVAYSGPFELAGRVYSKEDWFREALKRDFFISDVYLGYRNIPHFIIAVVKRDGDKKWIIRATIDTSFFSSLVERVRIGRTGEAYILNKEGRFQTPRRSGGELMSPEPDGIMPPVSGEVKTFVARSDSGEEYLYAAVWLNDKEWVLVARQEKAEAFEVLGRATRLALIVAILGGLLIVGLAFQTTHYIVSRLETSDTEKKELGRQLVVAGRLAEIGEMSAGFAHEINNPLQIIKSELTLMDAVISDLSDAGAWPAGEDADQIVDSMNQIQKQVNRCGGVTQGLLKFARKKESKPGRVELPDFLSEVIRLVENKMSVEGITLRVDTPRDLSPVSADPALLEQVVVNLLNNAIHAVVEKHGSMGGEIRVAAAPGGDGQVTVSVTDNGSGISPENMEKIFTPFFTTKPVGQGTGLGLPICYGIITEMGGCMDVTSEQGAGSTFVIRLNAA